MSNRKLIGRVSATEKYPSSCDDFQFWLSDDVVRVMGEKSNEISYSLLFRKRGVLGSSGKDTYLVVLIFNISFTYSHCCFIITIK